MNKWRFWQWFFVGLRNTKDGVLKKNAPLKEESTGFLNLFFRPAFLFVLLFSFLAVVFGVEGKQGVESIENFASIALFISSISFVVLSVLNPLICSDKLKTQANFHENGIEQNIYLFQSGVLIQLCSIFLWALAFLGVFSYPILQENIISGIMFGDYVANVSIFDIIEFILYSVFGLCMLDIWFKFRIIQGLTALISFENEYISRNGFESPVGCCSNYVLYQKENRYEGVAVICNIVESNLTCNYEAKVNITVYVNLSNDPDMPLPNLGDILESPEGWRFKVVEKMRRHTSTDVCHCICIPENND